MKFTPAILLLGLSLCSAYVPADAAFQPNRSCLEKALQTVPELLQSLTKLLCKYQHAKDTNNDKLFQEVYDDLKALLEKVGCTIDDLIDINAESLTEHVGEVLEHLIDEILKPLLADLGVTEKVFKAVCALAGDLLASECVEKLLAKNVPNLVDELQAIACKANDPDRLYLELYDALKNLGCGLDELLGTREELEKLSVEVAKLVDNATRELVRKVLEIDLIKTLVGTLLCPVVELVDDLLNGDGGLPILGGSGGLLG